MRKRRRASNGGINTRLRASGKWSFYYTASKGKIVERGGFESKETAYEAGLKSFNDYKHGNIGLTSEKVLVNDYIEHWLWKVKSAEVRLQTIECDELRAHAQLYPFFEGIFLQDVTPALVAGFVRKMYERGLSKRYISMCLNLLCQAMKHAVYPLQLIESNPARDIGAPRNAPTDITERQIIGAGKWDELINERFPWGNRLHVPLMLMYHTGMRVSEAVGLTWDCVDLERGTISVRRQLVKHKGWNELAAPKTRTSIRDIRIGGTLVEFLKRWREAQRTVNIWIDKAGKITQGGEVAANAERVAMVCTNASGRMVSRNIVEHSLRAEGVNPHSFRHTYATRCEEAGISAKAVAAQLGHKNIAITQNLYTHVTEKMKEDAALALEKYTYRLANDREKQKR